MSTLRSPERTLEAIEELTSRAALSPQELLEEAADRIDEVVPSDGVFISATDPHTTLPIGAGVVRDLPSDLCQPTWDYEFLVPDYLKFTDIASSGRTVADLHDATGGRPERSARWREYAAASGFRSELRAAFTHGGSTWGVAQFDRLGDSPRYSEDEKAWLDRVGPVLARGLRRALMSETGAARPDRGPGLVLLDEQGTIVSVTAEAAAWLDEIDATLTCTSADGTPLPLEAHAYASRARAAALEVCEGTRARLRTRTGVWLIVHGSHLPGTGQLALIIEPAKASDVAPLIVEAYGLTQRELEVTRMVARGLGTSQIAEQLFLSPHTVRDHVKSVLEKVGVSSRGELVAKVFADHYAPPPHT